jgi:hypothetical protein
LGLTPATHRNDRRYTQNPIALQPRAPSDLAQVNDDDAAIDFVLVGLLWDPMPIEGQLEPRLRLLGLLFALLLFPLSDLLDDERR